jgi:hypothetical protein
MRRSKFFTARVAETALKRKDRLLYRLTGKEIAKPARAFSRLRYVCSVSGDGDSKQVRTSTDCRNGKIDS